MIKCANADPMAENILIAMNEDNYPSFARDFNDKMKISLSKEKYSEKFTKIKKNIGNYIANTKEYLGYKGKGEKNIVKYKAQFTQKSEDVIIKIVFTRQEDKEYISGLWLSWV